MSCLTCHSVMSNFKSLLERRQSKNVLSQWRRYTDDFDKHNQDEDEEEDWEEFDCSEEEEEEEENDFYVRRPNRHRTSDTSSRTDKRPVSLTLKRSSIVPQNSEEVSKPRNSVSPRFSIAPLGWNLSQYLPEECSDSDVTCPDKSPSIIATSPSMPPNSHLKLEKRIEPDRKTESRFASEKRTEPDRKTEPRFASEKRTEPERRTKSNFIPQKRTEPERRTKSNFIPQKRTEPERRTKSNFIPEKRTEPERRTKSRNRQRSGESRQYKRVGRKEIHPRTTLKYFPKEQVSSTNSVPALFGASDTLGRSYSQSKYLHHYRDKFLSRSGDLGRCRSELTIVTPMEELWSGDRSGSYILCEAKSATPDATLSRTSACKMYELMRSPAVVIGGDLSDLTRGELSKASYAGTNSVLDSVSPTSSTAEDTDKEGSFSFDKTEETITTTLTPSRTCKEPARTCKEPSCRYLEVCPRSHKRSPSESGSTNSEQSSCSDVCLPACSSHVTQAETPRRVAEFLSQDSVEEGVLNSTSTDGFTVSTVSSRQEEKEEEEKKRENHDIKVTEPTAVEERKYDYDIKVIEPTPDTDMDSPDFQTYLDQIYEEGGEERGTVGEEVSVINSAISEESQAMVWSNINEVKRVLTKGENPITWLMNKTPVNSAIQSIFESTSESKNMFSSFISSQRLAISERAENETGPSSKWGGE